MSRKLTAEEESTVAEWIRANPCIYDKGDPEHKAVPGEGRGAWGTSGKGPSNLVYYAENLLWQVGQKGHQRCWGRALD